MLENVRFHPEEEANDAAFAKQLASLADVYVNDAFGAAHRAHASTEGVAHLLPAVAGLLMEKEIDYLSRAVVPECWASSSVAQDQRQDGAANPLRMACWSSLRLANTAQRGRRGDLFSGG
jgi:hypothetical protein